MENNAEIKKTNSHNRAVLKYYHKKMAEDEEYADKIRKRSLARYYARKEEAAQRGEIKTPRPVGRPRKIRNAVL
jgi:ribosomal protein S15P/S13E